MRRVVSPALALVLALAACHRSASERPFTLRIAVVGPLAALHPRLTESSAMFAHDLVYEAVLYPDSDGRPRSRIARTVDRLAPGSFRLELDPEARFSDGSPVGLDDIARAVTPAGATVRGDRDAVILSGPPATFEATLMYTVVYREVGGRPLGTGPFRLVDQTGDRIRLERVRHVPGRIERVEIISYPGERDVVAHTLRGDTNALLVLDVRKLEFFEGIPTLKVVRTQGPHVRAVEFNETKLGATERRALQAALPISDIVRAGCGPSDTTIPQPRREEAETPRRTLHVLVSDTDPLLRRAALAVRRALGSAHVRVESATTAEFSRALRAGRYDLAIANPIAWPPAAIGLEWGTHGILNASGFSSPVLDGVLAGGHADAVLPALQREAPVVLLCRRERGVVVDARIRNPTLSQWGALDALPEWEIDP